MKLQEYFVCKENKNDDFIKQFHLFYVCLCRTFRGVKNLFLFLLIIIMKTVLAA